MHRRVGTCEFHAIHLGRTEAEAEAGTMGAFLCTDLHVLYGQQVGMSEVVLLFLAVHQTDVEIAADQHTHTRTHTHT